MDYALVPFLLRFCKRRWREKAKQYKFKGHAAAIDSLFGDVNFSDFTRSGNSAAPPPPAARKKKEASEKAEDRFWKAYLQHVKRVHDGNQVRASREHPRIQYN